MENTLRPYLYVIWVAVGAFDSYLRARREEELMAFGVAQDTALQINPTDDEEQTE